MSITFGQLKTSDVNNPEARKAILKLSGLSGGAWNNPDTFLQNPGVFKEQLQNVIRQINEGATQSDLAEKIAILSTYKGTDSEGSEDFRQRQQRIQKQLDEQRRFFEKAGVSFESTPYAGLAKQFQNLETPAEFGGKKTTGISNLENFIAELPKKADGSLDLSEIKVRNSMPVIYADDAYKKGLITKKEYEYLQGRPPTEQGAKATDEDVKSLYQKYFNRQPSQPELDNWGEKGGSDTTVGALDKFLKQEQIRYGVAPAEGASAETAEETSPYIFDTKDYSDLPDDIKNSDVWQNASDYDKFMLYSTFKAKSTQDPQIQTQMLEAFGAAMEAFDPYYRMKTRLATDEIERSVSRLHGDYESNLQSAEKKIKQLKEDLIFNKDQLTIEQQQEMTDQLKNYKDNLYNTQQQMAESGLAFSSPRETAESNLLAEKQGLSQGTARKYARAFRSEELGAERQADALRSGIADLTRKKKEGLTGISRKAEEYLGSGRLPSIPGVSDLGGIQGTLKEEQQAKARQYGLGIHGYFKENI